METAVQLDADPQSAGHGTVTAGPLPAGLLSELVRQPPSPDEWRQVLALYTGSELPSDGRPAIVGSWTVDGEAVRFRPRYPLIPGLDYVVRFDLGRLRELATGRPAASKPAVVRLSLPAEEREASTVVTRVYPTASELPENLLRLYLHFSAPMSRGEAYERIRLVEAGGGVVAAPFLELTEELWDPGLRRLTLFFDPGRIKRGLRPHHEAGPPLREGATYRLEIDPAWRDAHGLPLAEGFQKTFTVTAPDRRSPDPGEWRLAAPAAGGREPFEVRFPEPLDHALLERVLAVRTAGGEAVAGAVEVGDGETSWRFVPERPWQGGSYVLEVATLLEDLAGNNLDTVFDVDLAGDAPPSPDRPTVWLPFTVGAPAN